MHERRALTAPLGRRIIARLITAVAAALVLVACGSAAPKPAPPRELCSSASAPPLEVCLVPSPQPVKAREAVTWELVVRNTGESPVELTFSSGQNGDVILTRDGVEVYRWSGGKVFTQAIRSERLGPSETRRYELRDRAEFFVKDPGRYGLRAVLTGQPDGGTPPPEVTGSLIVEG